MAFTRTPDDPTYVVKGDNATLVWEYSVDNRQLDLKGIVWSVTDKATSKSIVLVIETKSGNRSYPDDIPQAYKGRVFVVQSATLVIQNVTLNDSTIFSCFLRADPASSAVDTKTDTRLIVTGMFVSVTSVLCNISDSRILNINFVLLLIKRKLSLLVCQLTIRKGEAR